jgi:hypothetical protein
VRAVRRRSDRVMSAASRSRADTVEQGLGDAVGLFEGGKVARKGERVRLRVSNGVSYPRNEQFSSKQATLYAYLQGFCEKPSGRTRTVDPLLTMEDWSFCYATQEKRLVARFPCNWAGLSVRCTLPLEAPEPPWKSSNLSPEPSPNGARSRGPRWGLAVKSQDVV